MGLAQIIETQRHCVLTGKMKDIEHRKRILNRLKAVLKDKEQDLLDAVYNDFKKSNFDTYATELGMIYHEINLCLRNMESWCSPKKVSSGLLNFPATCYRVPEPYGHCLIMGTWNYPIQLTLLPLISAICAGNICLIKPSECAANSSSIMAQIINSNFSMEEIHVIEGGVELSEELLTYKYDKIFFTGSTAVGKIVAMAAAKHLTPTTLELGGKSPCVVLADADLDIAAKRIVWGKFMNAGQTCIAPDYLCVEQSIYEIFLEKLRSQLEKQFGRDPLNSVNFPRIINSRHVTRLEKLIKPDKLFYGGTVIKEHQYVSPTILRDIQFDDEPVMQDEIFGPILPVLKIEGLSQAIREIKKRPKPLSCYLFTRDFDLEKKFVEELSFGGGCINDTVMHVSNSNLPFGGVGESGTGSYHGLFGFEAFSHTKSILKRKYKFELPVKYAPQSSWKYKILKWLFNLN